MCGNCVETVWKLCGNCVETVLGHITRARAARSLVASSSKVLALTGNPSGGKRPQIEPGCIFTWACPTQTGTGTAEGKTPGRTRARGSDSHARQRQPRKANRNKRGVKGQEVKRTGAYAFVPLRICIPPGTGGVRFV